MSLHALANARVLTEQGFAERHAVVVDDGRIVQVIPVDSLRKHMPAEDLGGETLVPGFIDSQVNGGGGVLFNDDPSVESIEAIATAHRGYGTTGFLPTLISDDLEIVRGGIAAVAAAIEAGIPGVLGIHIEGPFLNPGRKGIHDAAKIRTLDARGMELITSLKSGKTLVTLAPECTTPTMIAQLAGAGVTVAAGHTNATYEDIRLALDHGLTGFTHLFNAMSPLAAREPGVVGAALEDPDAWCAIIVDGKHVSPVTLRLALRCKSADRFMLVTDAMPSVGSADKDFTLQGQAVRVVDGVCVNDNGTLAGSDLDMAQAVRNSVQMLGIDLAAAVRMASCNPAQFLGVQDATGAIKAGLNADLVLLDGDQHVLRTWSRGHASN